MSFSYIFDHSIDVILINGCQGVEGVKPFIDNGFRGVNIEAEPGEGGVENILGSHV